VRGEESHLRTTTTDAQYSDETTECSHPNRTLNLRTGTIARALSCAIEDHRHKCFCSRLPAWTKQFFDWNTCRRLCRDRVEIKTKR
jgi:hypothetical protein